MNPYIEFAQWAFAGWNRWYAGHGTKILGTISAAFGTLQAVLGAISADPHFALLVTPKQFALLSMFNIVLGVIVLRRGFKNTRAAEPAQS